MQVMVHFTWFDWVVLGILCLSMVISFFRGFLREAISLVGWLLAILLALKLSTALSGVFVFFSSPTIQYIAAFVSIVAVILLLSAIVGRVLKTIVSKTGLGIIDRSLGVCFGAARGVLAVAIFLMLLNVTVFQQATWFANSESVAKLRPIVVWLNGYLPAKLHTVGEWVATKPQQLGKGQAMQHVKNLKEKLERHLSN